MGIPVFTFYSCIVTYHKLSGLQQFTYVTVLYVRSPGTAQLDPLLRVSQGQNLGFSWSYGIIQGLEYFSKLI